MSNWTTEEFHKYQQRGTTKLVVNKKPFARARKHKRHIAGEMNKTEERFLNEWIKPRLSSGEILEYYFEAITLKLAEGCRYTPDFFVLDKEGYLISYEVKGTTKNASKKKEIAFTTDDAAVKIKVAPHHFPFQFFVAFPSKVNGGWNIQEK